MGKQKNHKKSARAFAEARKLLPGGVDSPVRAFAGVDTKPLFIAAAKGSKIYDIDGNEYIDYVGSWGPMILGHAHPKVLKAISAAAKKGTSFGAPTLAETNLAKKIIAAFDSIDMVRLVNSGTEAVMTAIRLARAYTKRDLIIKMAGCYHGHCDSLLVAAGSALAEAGTPLSAGVPDSFAKLTIVIPYNNIDAAKAAFQFIRRSASEGGSHKNKIAAVLLEPVAANMGVVPPLPGYLEALRNLCNAEDALLIFDEVITGFRLALGGAQQLFGVKADITCLGKIIGGGLPAAAVAGRADIMTLLAPVGPVYQAGTLSGNPLATAAANATLDILEMDLAMPDGKENCYEKLEASSALLQAGLADAAKDAAVPLTINRVGSIMSCFFTGRPVKNLADVQSTNIKQFKGFFAEMLKQGIYLAPSAYEAMFISLAHTKVDIERTVQAARNAFHKIKNKKSHPK